MVKVLSQSPLVFEVEAISLQARKDAEYYHPKYLEAIDRLNACPFEKKKLNDVVREPITDGDHEKREYSEDGVPYLRTVNIKEGQIDLVGIKRIPIDVHKRLKRSQVKSGDILLSIMATIGTVAIVPEDFEVCNANRTLCLIRPKKVIDPMYLASYLQTTLGKTLIERDTKGALQRRINLKDVKSMKIPIPPLGIQNKIAEIFEKAQRNRKKLLRQATMLGKIDNLILEKLEIELPIMKKRATFWVEPGKLHQRRDALFYHPNHLKVIEAIESTGLEIKTLGSISKIRSGRRPKGGVKYIARGIPSLGGEHITSYGTFNFEELKYIPRGFHRKYIRSAIAPLDILMVKDGATTGKVAIVSEDFPFEECNINEHVFRIRVEEDHDSYYVFSFLLSYLGQKQIEQHTSGAAQKGITLKAAAKIRVAIPQINVQREIAEEIKSRRNEIARLKKDADETIKTAKEQVEDIIEGKAVL